jgi:predicted enzyme related to lactoylglutathione lyase
MPTVTAHPPGTLCWLDLSTSDAEAGRAFYAALFGWTFEVLGPEMGFYSFAFNAGRPVGGVGQPPPEMNVPPSWTPYFSVADAAATIAQIEANGGKLVFGPMEIPEQGVQAVLMDATGAVFGIWEARPFPGAGVLDEAGALCWAEVNTREAPRARDFYATIFGLQGERMPGDMMEYYTLSSGGRARAGVLQMTAQWGDLPPHWMVYLAVDDVDAAAAKIQALGGKCHHGPFDTPYGRIAVVGDPQGAVFSIMHPTQLALES